MSHSSRWNKNSSEKRIEEKNECLRFHCVRMLIAHISLVENGKSDRNYSVNNRIGHCWLAHFCALFWRLTDKIHDKSSNCILLHTIKNCEKKNRRIRNFECISVLSTRYTCVGMNDKKDGERNKIKVSKITHWKYNILCDQMLSFALVHALMHFCMR